MAWNRDQILGVIDLPLKEIAVPAWGDDVTVWLRTMSVAERDRMFMLARDLSTGQLDPENFRAKVLVFCICDAEGNRLFREDEADLLGQKSAEAIVLLYNEARALNKLDRSETETVEDARKNS